MKNHQFLNVCGLIFCFIFLFNSCRQEDIAINNERNHQQNSKDISFMNLSQLKKETNIQKIVEFKKIGASVKNLEKNNDISNIFILDTLNIKKLEYKNSSTYSFRVFNSEQTSNKFFNLVVHQEKGIWVETLIKITIENNGIKHFDIINDSRYGDVESIDNGTPLTSKACVGTMEVYEFHCTCPPYYDECDGCKECVSSHLESFIYDCNDFSDGTSTPGGGTGSSSSGSGGGPTNPNDSGTYNTFTFATNDQLFNLCSENDMQCEIDLANQAMTVDYFNTLGINVLNLSSYTPIFNFVKSKLIEGYDQTKLSQRLTLVGNWFKLQDNSTDAKKLENFKFTHWALQFLINSDVRYFNYFNQYPADLGKIKLDGFNYNSFNNNDGAKALTSTFAEYLIAGKNNTINQITSTEWTWEDTKNAMIQLLKSNIAKGVEYGRFIYKFFEAFLQEYPYALSAVNEFVEFLKFSVIAEVPIATDPAIMKWNDILLCWLFEIGNFPVNNSAGYNYDMPTIGFAGTDYTISGAPNSILPMRHLTTHKMKNGNPDLNSVVSVREEAIARIQLNNLDSFSREWIFGSDATINTITKLDGLQFCLGSYQTVVSITALGNNQFKLTFIIKNKTGWQSGTRGLNDYNGNPLDDSIIPDKLRGEGIHLGGTIGETFGWYEIVTVY